MKANITTKTIKDIQKYIRIQDSRYQAHFSKYQKEELLSKILEKISTRNYKDEWQEPNLEEDLTIKENYLFIMTRNYFINLKNQSGTKKNKHWGDKDNIVIDDPFSYKDVLEANKVLEIEVDEKALIEEKNIQDKLERLKEIIITDTRFGELELDIFIWHILEGKPLLRFSKKTGVNYIKCLRYKKRMLWLLQQ